MMNNDSMFGGLCWQLLSFRTWNTAFQTLFIENFLSNDHLLSWDTSFTCAFASTHPWMVPDSADIFWLSTPRPPNFWINLVFFLLSQHLLMCTVSPTYLGALLCQAMPVLGFHGLWYMLWSSMNWDNLLWDDFSLIPTSVAFDIMCCGSLVFILKNIYNIKYIEYFKQNSCKFKNYACYIHLLIIFNSR